MRIEEGIGVVPAVIWPPLSVPSGTARDVAHQLIQNMSIMNWVCKMTIQY